MRSISEPTQIELCLESLQRCRAACEECSESRPKNTLGTAALRCLRLILQCAELCRETAHVLALADQIAPATLRNHVRSCSIACERCRREIERAGFLWAQDCADTCERAAATCITLLPTLPLTSARTTGAQRSRFE